ncbi:Ribonuclease H [Melia azedarach]|uniref:Ribonuclease H n=1 Tax=Melia azedarach TaxID=155640 RepID=A0ACC1YJP5_MELAZ|nr:Ribonuclease H [Melia azedarach]
MAVILAIELAFDKGWNHLWLESDSFLVIHLLLNKSLRPPWSLHNRWLNCLALTSHMSFRCSHAFRETNSAADAIANLSLQHESLFWWSSCPPQLGKFIFQDACGLPCYRFS